MEIIDLTTKEEMLGTFDVLNEMYPSLTYEDYKNELDLMLSNNYGQLAVFKDNTCIGLSGYWFNSKLWCGKYLELDNVIISKNYRGHGIGDMLFDAAQKKAEELGCSILTLDSYTDNFKAHKFFYNHGYVPRGFHFIRFLDEKKIR